MSATFNEDVQALKELVLHNPVRGSSWSCGQGTLKGLDAPSQRNLWCLGWDYCYWCVIPGSEAFKVSISVCL